VIGARITSTTEPNGLKTDAIGTSLNAITDDAGLGHTRALSIELWFSLDIDLVSGTTYVLYEVGGADSSNNNLLFTGSDDYQLRITFTRNPGTTDDVILVEYLLDNNGLTTGFISSTFQSSTFTGGGAAGVEAIGFNTANKIFMLVVTLSCDGNNRFVDVHVGQLGQTSRSTSSFSQSGSFIRRFNITATAVIRLGSTRNIAAGLRSIPGTVHFAAMYSRALSGSEVQSLLVGGIPNSLPALRSLSLNFVEDVTAAVNLNQANVVTYDFDGDSVTGFRIKTLPNKGTLFYNGAAIGTPDFPVADISLLTYRGLSDDFSATGTCGTPYTSFTFVATDGICDNSATQPNQANCNSPLAATATLCVLEANDAPDIGVSQKSASVFADTNTAQMFTVTCRDRDTTTGSFGLTGLKLTSQSNPTLGSIYKTASVDGACTSGAVVDLSGGPVTISANPAANVSVSFSFCYQAKPTTSSSLNLGSDVISFQCEDAASATTPSSVTIQVQNPLTAGCGDGSTTISQWQAGVKCIAVGAEDHNTNVRLFGNDAVVGHTLGNRKFRFNSVPTTGGLFTIGGPGTLITAGLVIDADIATGDLLVEYRPVPDYFNAMCNLNQDPVIGVKSASCSPSGPFVYQDGIGAGFGGCSSPTGCPITYSFSMLYSATSSQSPAVTGEIVMLGVNDPGSVNYIVGPTTALLVTKNVDVLLSTLKDSGGQALQYNDPDGDIFRVGFLIQSASSRMFVRSPGPFSNPEIDNSGERPRVAFLEGSSCLITGTIGSGIPCRIRGKAYPSDLNRLLSQLAISWQGALAGSTDLEFKVWDPVDQPGEFRVEFTDFDGNAPTTISRSIAVTYDATAESSGGTNVAQYAGYAVAGFGAVIGVFAASVLITKAYGKHKARRAYRQSMALQRKSAAMNAAAAQQQV